MAGICGLAVLFWLYHQPCQAAVAEEVASEPASAEISHAMFDDEAVRRICAVDVSIAEEVAEEVAAVVTSEAAEVVLRQEGLDYTCTLQLWDLDNNRRECWHTDRQGLNARKGWKHLRRARYWWQLQQAKLLVQQWREQYAYGEQPAVAAEMAREDQPAAAAGELSAAAGDQLAIGRGSRRRRRHRIRRRTNGAPRSCVLESGRWINLPKARQRTALMVASVSKCNRARCKFNDSLHGCQRSNCKYPPAGHAPEVDGPDVLDPMVESELDKLRARVSMLEVKMHHS